MQKERENHLKLATQPRIILFSGRLPIIDGCRPVCAGRLTKDSHPKPVTLAELLGLITLEELLGSKEAPRPREKPRRAFEVALEEKHYQDLSSRYGTSRARQIMEYRLRLQLQAVVAEVLGLPTYRWDLMVENNNGTIGILAVGDEHLGDVRNLTRNARERYPDDPRILAEHLGWTAVYNQLSQAPNGSVAVLISPGGKEYRRDMIYLLRVEDEGKPNTRLIRKVSITMPGKLDLGSYLRVIGFPDESSEEIKVNQDPETVPKVEAVPRWIPLLFPQIRKDGSGLGQAWQELTDALGLSGRKGVPNGRDIDQITGQGDNAHLTEIDSRVRNLAVKITAMLVDREATAKIQTVVNKGIMGIVHWDRSRFLTRPATTVIVTSCGVIDVQEDESLEEVTVNGETWYRCKCGRLVKLDPGYCPYCGYKFRCGGSSKSSRIDLLHFLSGLGVGTQGESK